MFSKVVNFSLNEAYLEKFNRIAKAEFTDRSKLLRKWIDQNYKKEYDKNNE